MPPAEILSTVPASPEQLDKGLCTSSRISPSETFGTVYFEHSLTSFRLFTKLLVNHLLAFAVKMSDRSTPEEDSQAPTTAPSSPPDLASVDAGLDDGEVRKMKEEDRKARADNRRDEVKRQKNLAIRRKRAQQETAADREAKAKQLESLLAKSAVSSNRYRPCYLVHNNVGP